MVTAHLPFGPIIGVMSIRRNRGVHAALLSLEADAASARGGFACRFSTADEYESAVINERRAQGRYHRRSALWPLILLAGCVAAMAGTVLLWAVMVGFSLSFIIALQAATASPPLK